MPVNTIVPCQQIDTEFSLFTRPSQPRPDITNAAQLNPDIDNTRYVLKKLGIVGPNFPNCTSFEFPTQEQFDQIPDKKNIKV